MPLPDVEALCSQLAEQVRPHLSAHTALVGIHTGGVWVADRLRALLGLAQPNGALDISFYRDDYRQRGLHARPQTSRMPFEVDGAHIILVDDVLYTGRTVRAALNEIFDYGRPARIDLAVLIDRGGRELPIAAQFCPHTLELPPGQMLALEREHGDRLVFRLTET